MKKNPLRAFMTNAMVAIAAAATLSCEKTGSDSGGNSFTIDPSEIIISESVKSVALTAVGGELPITWSVSDDQSGRIVGDGMRVVYNSITLGPNQVKAVDNRGWVATALVTGQGQSDPLTIDPSSVTIPATVGQYTFTAHGGSGNYKWQCGHGNPTTGEGKTFTYKATSTAGLDQVIVTDDSSSAYATVTVTSTP